MITVLNQDYPTAGALAVTQVPAPETFTLYVFFYSDWQCGNQQTSYAQGYSALTSTGSWVSTVSVLSGTYTVVAKSSTTTVVIAPHLVI